MLGGAREFRYDCILLRARNLPHEAGGTPAPLILRDGSRRNIAKLPGAIAQGIKVTLALAKK